jgi:hypothetical protein
LKLIVFVLGEDALFRAECKFLVELENDLAADFVPSLRDEGAFCSLTQDCAALVLGYYPFSLRENDHRLFHPSRPEMPVGDCYNAAS